MLGEQFYPTPASFLNTIRSDFKEFFENFGKYETSLTILEPSAGKGDIADWWKKGGHDLITYKTKYGKEDYTFRDWGGRDTQIDVIEVDATLQATLKGKKYPVVAEDFLSFETFKRYDLIMMNPPFADGEHHLLKAIHLQERYGGSVLCILNAETIRNPYTNARKTLQALLDKYGAEVKFYQDAFNSTDSERKTGVEVAVVALRIELDEKTLTDSKIFKELDEAKVIPNILSESEQEEKQELILAGLDWIDSLVKQYEEEMSAGLAIIREFAAYKAVVGKRYENVQREYDNGYLNLCLGENSYKNELKDVNLFVKATRLRYWEALFNRPEFYGKMTSKMQEAYRSEITNMSNFEFSIKNILKILAEIRENSIIGIEKSIMSLFETLTTKYSYWSETCGNIHYYNGWKSNSAYKVNKKVVLPINSYSAWGDKKELRYYNVDSTLVDLSKAFDFLSDKSYQGIDSASDVENAVRINFEIGNGKNIETKYFILTFYKKGTCHVVIKDDTLRERLNLYVGKQKGWLPPDFGTKPYSAMSEEEREVAISYAETEEHYAEICANQSKYLLGRENFLQIVGSTTPT